MPRASQAAWAGGIFIGLLILVVLIGGQLMTRPAETGTEMHAGAQPLKTGHPPGYPARGRQIDIAALDHELPPPPKDSVPFQVRVPLRNGHVVREKERWLWIPEGSKVMMRHTPDSKIAIKLPVGALLWKEFYIKTSLGLSLIERRILLKVSDRPEENGWLSNGGWRFYTAHHLPAKADGIQGFKNELSVSLHTQPSRRFFFRPDQWLPTREKSAPTFVTFTDREGGSYPFVFPGTVNCEVCHGGAAGAYGNSERLPFLAFGPHPENLTRDSFKALVDRGWIDAPSELIDRYLSGDEPASRPAVDIDKRTREVIAELRNNCLSCHNSSKHAAGSQTAFVMEPGHRYSRQEAFERLAVKSSLMGVLSVPLVTPGQPGDSEIWLRLTGTRGRRRMPPAEGGVPDPDVELTRITTAWIAEPAPP